MEIQLLLPQYLVKYMRKLYGEPYRVSHQDEVGLYILNVLKRKTTASQYRYAPRKGVLLPYMIALTSSVYSKRGCIITQEQIALMVKFVDSRFRHELFRQALVNYRYFKIPYKDSLMAGLEFYDIQETELPYDTIRKDFNRKKRGIVTSE